MTEFQATAQIHVNRHDVVKTALVAGSNLCQRLNKFEVNFATRGVKSLHVHNVNAKNKCCVTRLSQLT